MRIQLQTWLIVCDHCRREEVVSSQNEQIPEGWDSRLEWVGNYNSRLDLCLDCVNKYDLVGKQ